MSSEAREMICNDDTFKLPPYTYAMYKIHTECPETGRKSCSSVIASTHDVVDVPENGCVIDFCKSDGTKAEQSIKLIREDADKLEAKRQANREAQALANAKEGMKPLEGMVEQYMTDAPDGAITDEKEATTGPQILLDESSVDMSSDDMLDFKGPECEDDCECEDECEMDSPDSDGELKPDFSGDSFYSTPDSDDDE